MSSLPQLQVVDRQSPDSRFYRFYGGNTLVPTGGGEISFRSSQISESVEGGAPGDLSLRSIHLLVRMDRTPLPVLNWDQ